MTDTPDAQERSHHSGLFAFSDLDATIARAMGDRAEAWMAYRADWKRGAVDRPYPLQIDFTLSDSCNMKCPMCTWSEDAKRPSRRVFSLETFSRIVNDGVPKGLKGVGLNGVNEPLMRADLPDFVRAAKRAGVLDVMLHTNAMLLTERMARELIRAGLTRLMVSLDAATQETYDQIRVGGNLAIVDRNIERFLALRTENGTVLPVLGVCFVRMAVNAHEEPAFIERWRDSADFFVFQSYMNPFDEETLPDKRTLAIPGTRAPTLPPPCPQPFQRLRLQVDGRVNPCCAFWGDHLTVGQVVTGEEIDAAWGSAGAIRDMHATGRLWTLEARGPDAQVCRQCLSQSYTEASEE